jgi:hypothetical protein
MTSAAHAAGNDECECEELVGSGGTQVGCTELEEAVRKGGCSDENKSKSKSKSRLLSTLYLSMLCFSFFIPVGRLGKKAVLSRVCLTPLPLDFLVSSNKAPLSVRKIRFTRDFGGNRKCKCLIRR